MATRKVLNRRVLSQAFLALAFDLGGIFSGRIALLFSPFFESSPWILALFPPMLSVRGDIGGIFSGKLGTMLHVGTVEPRLRRNTREFYLLIRAIFFLTFVDTVGTGSISFIVNFSLGNVAPQHLIFFILVPPITCLLAMAIVTPLGALFGTIVFKKGLDPDIILYPAMSTVDDVVITICYVLVVNLTLVPNALLGMSVAMVLLVIFFLIMFVRYGEDRIFKQTLAEGAPMVLISSFLGTLGGVGLASIREDIERRPSILMLYPALIDTLGDIGSILGAMETTKLALGQTRSFLEAFKERLSDLVSVEIAAAVMHIFFGLAVFLLGSITGLSPDLSLLVKIALISNIISFLSISVLSIAVATQTFKHGLDPDNFVIPLVTSISDLSATFALIASLLLLRV